jgi:hypothetical protein
MSLSTPHAFWENCGKEKKTLAQFWKNSDQQKRSDAKPAFRDTKNLGR